MSASTPHTLFLMVLLSSICISVFGDVSFETWQDLQCSRQCHGDATCTGLGPLWVSTSDVMILQACFPLPVNYGELRYDPRADFDRNFKINNLDVDIIQFWLNQLNVPDDCGKKLTLESISEQCLVPDSNYTIEWQWQIYTEYVPMPGDPDFGPGPIAIFYSLDYGYKWILIDTVASGYSYEWTVPQSLRNHLDIQIVDTYHPGLIDTASWWTDCNGVIIGDLNNDCYVDGVDFALLALSWLDESGTDINDLNDLASDWLLNNNPCHTIPQ